jgi:uncharacterized protein YfbU (UPF0304 family)
MVLTKVERTILANQNKILAFLDKDKCDSYLRNVEIAEQGYESRYYELLNTEEEVSKEVCDETTKILNMCWSIEQYIRDQKPNEPDLNSIKFEGFDANNDPHYKFAKFILPEYDNTEKWNLNSHNPNSLDKYKRMLRVYEKHNKPLDLSILQEIIASIKNY